MIHFIALKILVIVLKWNFSCTLLLQHSSSIAIHKALIKITRNLNTAG
jgi:hypothetical protein